MLNRQAAYSLSFIAFGALLYYLPETRRVFSWLWLIGRPDVVGWWPIEGAWFWAAVASLMAAIFVTAFCYSEGRSRRTMLAVSTVCAVVCLGMFLMAGRARVEVRANDIRVTAALPWRPDDVYRAEQASRMAVQCRSGGRRRSWREHPSLKVWFGDGRKVELQQLTSRAANPNGELAGLRFTDQLDVHLSLPQNDRAVRRDHLDARCVERTANRLGSAHRARIARLFRREGPLVEVYVPQSGES